MKKRLPHPYRMRKSFFIATQHIPTFDKKFYQFPNHFFAYHADN